ncbi:hypothetical protein HanOQP8_Chr10g0363931 [Helianthus annuus]|nr:hypothetical protein HanOQP8_Chr10g0363931 [Helianthus annuus]
MIIILNQTIWYRKHIELKKKQRKITRQRSRRLITSEILTPLLNVVCFSDGTQ